MFLIQKKWKISEMQYDRFIPRFRKKSKTYKKGTTGLFQRQKNSKNFPEGGDRFIHGPVYFPLYGNFRNS